MAETSSLKKDTSSNNALQKNKGWRIWWRLLRPHTLTAAFIPVLVGTSLALSVHHLSILLFLAMLFASLLIQSATNMFNEYYDYKRGLDTEHSVGIGGTIVRDGVKAETVLKLAYAFLAISVLLGIYICVHSSWWVAVIGIICMAAGYFYTGGPFPIAYTPFGELTSGLFMGLMIVLISFYIQTGTITEKSVLVSIPIAVLIGGILLANNIRDLDGDKDKGRLTLAILLGRSKAISLLSLMFIFSNLWIVTLIIAGMASPWLLLVLISIPKAVQATRLFKGKTLSVQLMPAMQATAQMHTLFGGLLALGLIIAHWF
ncbi:MAG TPA: 1,4-dihydroxy-2-naphthoate polyprenyltransferase [Bacillales bacterium]|nr:1,4-dihydroxy-2-naphthoate polyprenyltransferase [Bacillales bacterium]